MANNLDFTTATYATSAMLPDAYEELTADWARKVMQNTGRANGYWGTVVCSETSVATLGTGFIYFTGFDFMPSVDLWIYERKGTLNAIDRITQWSDTYTPADESGRVVGKRVIYSRAAGTGTIKLEVYPHPHANGVGPENEDFNSNDYGTWIYRLRGI